LTIAHRVYLNFAAAWAWVRPPDEERLQRFVTAMVDLDRRDEELHPPIHLPSAEDATA